MILELIFVFVLLKKIKYKQHHLFKEKNECFYLIGDLIFNFILLVQKNVI